MSYDIGDGYNIWSNNINGNGAAVQSLIAYRPASTGTERLFAAAGTSIYEVSNIGVTTLSKGSLSGTSRWQYVNFTVPGGSSYLYLVNGINAPLAFDGTNWTNPSITGTTTSPNNFINIHTHMNRLFFVENNSTRVWYLPVQSIAGAANDIDVGALVTKGSYVVATSTWTVDGGNGPNSLLCIFTAKGQVVIYQGTDPTNSASWTLVGVFDLPTPIGTRCVRKIGSDVAIVTNQGLLPLSKALPFNPASQREVTFTYRIQNAMQQAALNYSSNFGWECVLFPKQTLMFLNVPTSANISQTQYVMNTITGAWCSIVGWNANTFEIYNEDLYFGDNNGNVCLAYTGRTDFTSPIQADCKCAFNFFDAPGRVKDMSMLKPYMVVDGTITPSLSVDVDFADNSTTSPVIISPSGGGGVWNVGLWDVATWGGGSFSQALWQSVYGLGTALAVRIKINYGGTSNTSLLTGIGAFDIGVFDSAIFDGTGASVGSFNLPTVQVVAFESIIQPGGPV